MTPKTTEVERNSVATLSLVIYTINGEPAGYFKVETNDGCVAHFKSLYLALKMYSKESERLWKLSLKQLENRERKPDSTGWIPGLPNKL